MTNPHSDKQLQLCGKGWEIRHRLRQLKRTHPPGTTLQQALDKAAFISKGLPLHPSRKEQPLKR